MNVHTAAYDGHAETPAPRQSFGSTGRSITPLREGFDAFGFGGAVFLGLRTSLLLLRWPFATVISFG